MILGELYLRKKYNIPEVDPSEDEMTEILLADEDIDWDAVRLDVNAQMLPVIIGLLPDAIKTLLEALGKTDAEPPEVQGRVDIPDDIRKSYVDTYTSLLRFFQPVQIYLEQTFASVSDMVFEILLTGKTRDLPANWMSLVFTMHLFGNPTVVAMASQLSNPKDVAEQFKAEFTKTFGHDRPKITEGNLRTAEYLAMKLSGKPLRDILDIYIQRNPSQFPKDKSSKAYARAVSKQRERIKKNIQRLQDTLDKMLGDKN
jgi:hypothetical protein